MTSFAAKIAQKIIQERTSSLQSVIHTDKDGDKAFTLILIPAFLEEDFKKLVAMNADFSKLGIVLAEGKGEPSEELVNEILGKIKKDKKENN